jgi:hypothetical protein
VELDNSQTEICGVELEVEWSLWSGAEVFGVELSQTAPKEMLVDPLTKGLPPNVFEEHIAGMGLRESL